MTEKNFALWNFSLEIYAQPEVMSSCLELQDAQGADVNILLWCLWLEQQQKKLTVERLQDARDLVDTWVESTIKPLRQTRRKLKQHYGTIDAHIENLRQTIKQAELLAEQQEQWLLQSLAINWQQETSCIPTGTNLRLYLTELQIAEDIYRSNLAKLCKAISC